MTKPYWPGDSEQALQVLRNSWGDPNHYTLITRTIANESLWQKTADWAPIEIVKGAAFCAFNDLVHNPIDYFIQNVWHDIFFISIKPKYDLDLLVFARDFEFFEKFPEPLIIEGCRRAISYSSFTSFSLLFETRKDLHNLEFILYILNVQEKDSIRILDKCFYNDSLMDLLDFLETNQCSINKEFLLDKK